MSCQPELARSGFNTLPNKPQIMQIGKLPQQIVECSGLIAKPSSGYWAINDGGNNAEIFELDSQFNLTNILTFPLTKNTDWEAITSDSMQNIYVGNFGNNLNTRRDLSILKLSGQGYIVNKLDIQYAEQQAFPPIKRNKNFDCEAFFYYQDSLYLFSKNRGKKLVNMYSMATNQSKQNLKTSANIFLKTQITDAALSPSKNQFVLLGYGKVYFFGIAHGKVNFAEPQYCIKLALKQAEAICYLSDNELIICNEQRDIYRLLLP